MFRRSHTKRTTGQALVEFALAATLIFVLLSAAVDLGLIFFTMQGLHAAAQEGATFGSYPEVIMSGSNVQGVDLKYSQIVARVRSAGGNTPSGFANLMDLNNNGINDDFDTGVIDNPRSSGSYIYVENLLFSGDDLTKASTGSCETTVARYQMRKAGEYCYVRVTVSYEYRFIFPLAPVFRDTIRLRASYLLHVRSSFVG